ncbi:MAG TPA: hypothetical protein VEL02_01300 [Jatrophihabitantaceae bacterium]|nr:hypothetical protein [Jatrophihabitantaceae bacterium]
MTDTMPHGDVTRRLFTEFGAELPMQLIAATVRECRCDLDGDGAPHPALPELVERLARQRLTDRLGGGTSVKRGRSRPVRGDVRAG